MSVIVVSGPAHAFADDPRAEEPIAGRRELLRFHGLVSEEGCVDTFETPLNELGLAGGRLRFALADDGSGLRITTAYRVPRPLTDQELSQLVEATTSQWSDGCGSGSFQNCYGVVLSTALAMAIQNSDPEADVGSFFVDAFPLLGGDDAEITIEEVDALKDDADYLQEAADLGDPQAQFSLARRLTSGDGVDKDERLAIVYYQKASAQGHLPALTFLGLCHDRGTGTAKNPARAIDCFRKAAEAGYPLAMHCLGECYQEGRGVERDLDAGIQWYRRGVDLDDMGCTAELGECYEYGKGVPKDLHAALALYQCCTIGGFDVAEAIERVKKQLGE